MGEALWRAKAWKEQLERYTACYGGVPLRLHLSLEQNGIPDSTSELRSLRLDPKDFIPTVLLYFNDDAGNATEGRTSKHPQNPKDRPLISSKPADLPLPPPPSECTGHPTTPPKNTPGPHPSKNP